MSDRKPLNYSTWYPASERMPPDGSRIDLRLAGHAHGGYRATLAPEPDEEWRLVYLPDGWMLPSVMPEEGRDVEVICYGSDAREFMQPGPEELEEWRDAVRLWRYATPIPEGL